MELKLGDVLVFKDKTANLIGPITIWGVDCNRRVRYSYGLVDEKRGYLFANEKDLLKETKKLSKLEIELL